MYTAPKLVELLAKQHEKREVIKSRDWKREQGRLLKK